MGERPRPSSANQQYDDDRPRTLSGGPVMGRLSSSWSQVSNAPIYTPVARRMPTPPPVTPGTSNSPSFGAARNYASIAIDGNSGSSSSSSSSNSNTPFAFSSSSAAPVREKTARVPTRNMRSGQLLAITPIAVPTFFSIQDKLAIPSGEVYFIFMFHVHNKALLLRESFFQNPLDSDRQGFDTCYALLKEIGNSHNMVDWINPVTAEGSMLVMDGRLLVSFGRSASFVTVIFSRPCTFLFEFTARKICVEMENDAACVSMAEQNLSRIDGQKCFVRFKRRVVIEFLPFFWHFVVHRFGDIERVDRQDRAVAEQIYTLADGRRTIGDILQLMTISKETLTWHGYVNTLSEDKLREFSDLLRAQLFAEEKNSKNSNSNGNGNNGSNSTSESSSSRSNSHNGLSGGNSSGSARAQGDSPVPGSGHATPGYQFPSGVSGGNASLKSSHGHGSTGGRSGSLKKGSSKEDVEAPPTSPGLPTQKSFLLSDNTLDVLQGCRSEIVDKCGSVLLNIIRLSMLKDGTKPLLRIANFIHDYDVLAVSVPLPLALSYYGELQQILPYAVKPEVVDLIMRELDGWQNFATVLGNIPLPNTLIRQICMGLLQLHVINRIQWIPKAVSSRFAYFYQDYYYMFDGRKPLEYIAMVAGVSFATAAQCMSDISVDFEKVLFLPTVSSRVARVDNRKHFGTVNAGSSGGGSGGNNSSSNSASGLGSNNSKANTF